MPSSLSWESVKSCLSIYNCTVIEPTAVQKIKHSFMSTGGSFPSSIQTLLSCSYSMSVTEVQGGRTQWSVKSVPAYNNYEPMNPYQVSLWSLPDPPSNPFGYSKLLDDGRASSAQPFPAEMISNWKIGGCQTWKFKNDYSDLPESGLW